LPRVENFAAYLSDAKEMHWCQSLNLHNVHAFDIRGTSEDVFSVKVLHTTFGHTHLPICNILVSF